MRGDESVRLAIPRNVTWKAVKSGVVVLNIEKGIYYTLNETASRVWKLLVEGKSADAIRKDLGEAYEVEDAALDKDLSEAVAFLKKESLVEEV